MTPFWPQGGCISKPGAFGVRSLQNRLENLGKVAWGKLAFVEYLLGPGGRAGRFSGADLEPKRRGFGLKARHRLPDKVVALDAGAGP